MKNDMVDFEWLFCIDVLDVCCEEMRINKFIWFCCLDFFLFVYLEVIFLLIIDV